MGHKLPKNANSGRKDTYTKAKANKFYKFVEEGMTLVQACHAIGVAISTMKYEWCRKYEECQVIYDRAKEIVEDRLVRECLEGKRNYQMTSMILRCSFGWMEEDKRQRLDLLKKETDARVKALEEDDGKTTQTIKFKIIEDDEQK